jgi:hypothetical protein
MSGVPPLACVFLIREMPVGAAVALGSCSVIGSDNQLINNEHGDRIALNSRGKSSGRMALCRCGCAKGCNTSYFACC